MIQLRNVRKIFDARGIAGIHDLSLEIPTGKVLALLGSNGSGKTTLLNLIAGKLLPDSGEIRVEGKIHFFELRKPESELNVQKFLISCVTAEVDAEKKVQLARDMADIFEFTFQLRQNIGQLSQGQLQKVLMAAELINQPDILFLDEPFVHLDPLSRKDILFYLFQYLQQRQVTVVWITHERDEALRFADAIGLLQHGRLEQSGTPIELLSSPRNLYVAQFFGFENFIKVTGSSGNWKTPFGNKTSSLKAEEAYLVIPSNAWKLDPSSVFKATIRAMYPQFTQCLLDVEVDERRFQVALPLWAFGRHELGVKIGLSVDLDQCQTIPL
jgi:ABC-type Fe3+/spermidine/putrescine transport system ATPase subunit